MNELPRGHRGQGLHIPAVRRHRRRPPSPHLHAPAKWPGNHQGCPHHRGYGHHPETCCRAAGPAFPDPAVHPKPSHRPYTTTTTRRPSESRIHLVPAPQSPHRTDRSGSRTFRRESPGSRASHPAATPTPPSSLRSPRCRCARRRCRNPSPRRRCPGPGPPGSTRRAMPGPRCCRCPSPPLRTALP